MAAAPNAFPPGTLRCKKLKRDGGRKRKRGRKRRPGAAEIQLSLEKGIPDTVGVANLRFSSRKPPPGVAYVSYVSRHVSSCARVSVARVYSGSTNDRPACIVTLLERKSFGGRPNRGRRKWTERTGTCCRGSRVSSSRLTGKRPASTTHKTP